MKSIAVLMAGLLAAAGGAQAATLTHAYEFDGPGVTDTVGGINGTLIGGATISNGRLQLTGRGTYAELAGKAVPLSGAFSVYLKFFADSQQNWIEEVISQGETFGPGFYIGRAGTIRVTDYAIFKPIAFPTGEHEILFTTGNGSTALYFDGSTTPAFTDPRNFVFSSGGSNTRFGAQFQDFGEYFTGNIDSVRVFDGVATFAEARAAGAVPEPATWALMILGFGAVGGAMRRRQSVAAKVRFA